MFALVGGRDHRGELEPKVIKETKGGGEGKVHKELWDRLVEVENKELWDHLEYEEKKETSGRRVSQGLRENQE